LSLSSSAGGNSGTVFDDEEACDVGIVDDEEASDLGVFDDEASEVGIEDDDDEATNTGLAEEEAVDVGIGDEESVIGVDDEEVTDFCDEEAAWVGI